MASPKDSKNPNGSDDPAQNPTPTANPAQNQAAAQAQTPAPSTQPTAHQPKFKRVTRKFDSRSGARSKSAYVMVEPTGRSEAGVKCTRLADTLAAELGFDLHRYHLAFEADPELKIVGAFLCNSTEPGAMPVRRSKDGKTISFHLGGVLEDYPDLRPAGKTDCGVERMIDEHGRPYLQISLGTGLAHRKRNHSGSATKAKGGTESATMHEREDEFEDDD